MPYIKQGNGVVHFKVCKLHVLFFFFIFLGYLFSIADCSYLQPCLDLNSIFKYCFLYMHSTQNTWKIPFTFDQSQYFMKIRRSLTRQFVGTEPWDIDSPKTCIHWRPVFNQIFLYAYISFSYIHIRLVIMNITHLHSCQSQFSFTCGIFGIVLPYYSLLLLPILI